MRIPDPKLAAHNEELLAAMLDGSTHPQLRVWIWLALEMDPIDSANDAEWLASALDRRAQRMLEEP